MSNRICHACISFLNSWQSFKNRCHAAQKKQQTFLDIFMAKERAKKTVDSIQMAAERQRQLQQQRALANAQQQRILKSALTQSMTATPYTTSNTNSFDVVHIHRFRHRIEHFSFSICISFSHRVSSKKSRTMCRAT